MPNFPRFAGSAILCIVSENNEATLLVTAAWFQPIAVPACNVRRFVWGSQHERGDAKDELPLVEDLGLLFDAYC